MESVEAFLTNNSSTIEPHALKSVREAKHNILGIRLQFGTDFNNFDFGYVIVRKALRFLNCDFCGC